MKPPSIDRFDAITLERLNETAGLLNRVDRKYIVPCDELSTMLQHMITGCTVLEIDGYRSFGYRSVYFDDIDRASYHRSATGRRQRYKVRTRTYLDSGLCMAEVKVRGARGHNIKLRQPHPQHKPANLDDGLDFVQESLATRGCAADLEALLETTYWRSTFLHSASNSRITIDTNLSASLLQGSRSVALPSIAIVETKSAGGANNADRWLWSNGHRPSKVSKYATLLAMLDPSLAHNKWHRTIERIRPYAEFSDRFQNSFVSAAELKRRRFVAS